MSHTTTAHTGCQSRGGAVVGPYFRHQLLPLGFAHQKKNKKPSLLSKLHQATREVAPCNKGSFEGPCSSTLIYWSTTLTNATTKPVQRKRWHGVLEKFFCHGSVVYSCGGEDAKEPAVKSVIIMSPLLLTYSFCKLCNSLWMSFPLAVYSLSRPYAQPAITLYFICSQPLLCYYCLPGFICSLKAGYSPLAGTQISSVPFLCRLFPVFHYSYQSC